MSRRRGRRDSSGFRVRHPALFVSVLSVIGAFAIVFVALSLLNGSSGQHNKEHPDYPYSVQMFVDQGHQHFPVGEVKNGYYNSNPPTSGDHAAVPATWGVHDEAVPKEQAVHNMEHGGVVVWYNCDSGGQPLDANGCAALKNQLMAVVKPDVDDGMFIVMTPYSEMDSRIALTAWQYLDTFDNFDAARVRAFIASFECRSGPEATAFCR